MMAEDRDVPFLGIHVMTECDYCARAGLLAYESKRDDSGEEFSVEDLDFLPMYNLSEINRELNLRCPDVYRWLLVALAIGGLTFILASFFRWYFVISGAIGLAIVGKALVDVGKPVVTLVIRRTKAQWTRPRMPDHNSPENETVGWWEIRNSDFEATVPQEPLVDHELRLSGKPWKVLRNHSNVVIPVFKRKKIKQLHRQHYARIAAYCRLIEECEGATSPYGLILESGTYRAIAIKNTARAQRTLHTVLHYARSVIEDYAKTGKQPPPPVRPQPDCQNHNRNGPCWECPIGFPRLHILDETELISDEVRLQVFPAFSTHAGDFHSMCGDRFEWRPPHKRFEWHKRLRRRW